MRLNYISLTGEREVISACFFSLIRAARKCFRANLREAIINILETLSGSDKILTIFAFRAT